MTSLLLYALENKLIDGAIVSHRTGLFSRTPVLAMTPGEVIDAAGSHYDDVTGLGEIGKSYTSFVPTIREVGKLRQRGLNRIAFVGTPCQVYSLRKMQLLNVVPSDTIVLIIGLFCMENFSFNEEVRKKLEKKLGIKLDKVEKLNIKDDVIMTMSGGETLQVPFELMDEVARPACFACSDFTNEYADISCGGLELSDRFTTVVVRTNIGERVYNGEKQKKFIDELKFRNKEQSILHRTTLMAKIVSFTRRKQDRRVRMFENLQNGIKKTGYFSNLTGEVFTLFLCNLLIYMQMKK